MIELGVDIESIERFKKYDIKQDIDFLKTIFTDKELEYCFSTKLFAKHLTARFCGKEALIKAVSNLGININFNQIEILNSENGKPYFNFSSNEVLNNYEIKLSMSHEKDYAMATVVLFKREQ